MKKRKKKQVSNIFLRLFMGFCFAIWMIILLSIFKISNSSIIIRLLQILIYVPVSAGLAIVTETFCAWLFNWGI